MALKILEKRKNQNIFVPWEKFIDENNNTNAIREQLALYCSASTLTEKLRGI